MYSYSYIRKDGVQKEKKSLHLCEAGQATNISDSDKCNNYKLSSWHLASMQLLSSKRFKKWSGSGGGLLQLRGLITGGVFL